MNGWWIPRSASDIEFAVEHRTVTEGHHLDFKEFLGERPRRAICAGANCCQGCREPRDRWRLLVLGVREDKRISILETLPRPLSGLRDAVDQLIANRVTPGLRVTVVPLDRGDGTGFLAVLVPASARAPHMVDGRFYGRNDSTDRPLPARILL